MRPARILFAAALACAIPQLVWAQPVRVGGAVKEPAIVTRVEPVYPSIAQRARVAGTVIIEATIDKDGRVSDARVLRSIALLDQAALDAVRQWRFSPTSVNGAPVEVIMTVSVNFRLEDPDRQSGAGAASQTAGGMSNIDSLLEQAKELRQQRRLDEAEALLMRALVELRKERDAITNPPAPPDGPVRVGGAIKEPVQLKRVEPRYPSEAAETKVQGTVILEAVIDKAGEVAQVRVLRSIPLLDQAAIEAVRQWRYMPTLLNGAPVEILMTVTVNFSLK